MLREYIRRGYRTLLPLLYARRNYKFFMAGSFADLDSRVRRLVLASNMLNAVLRPILVAPPFGKKVLVVAPHQDDEAIGCGGAVLAHLNAGGRARTVVVQDGCGAEHALGMTREALMEMREGESMACARRMGCDEPEFLRFSAVDGQTAGRVADRLSAVLKEYAPDAIFAPSVLDNNLEHAYAAKALAMALEATPVKAQVYSYEVWGLCIPNTAVNIDRFIDGKMDLIACFASQTRNNDYAHAFRGLAMYHALQFGAVDVRHVERFFAQPAGEYVGFVRSVMAEKAD